MFDKSVVLKFVAIRDSVASAIRHVHHWHRETAASFFAFSLVEHINRQASAV